MNIVNKLEQSVTVEELIRHLQALDPEARVVFVSPYGDRGRTQQAFLVERINEHPASTLYTTGYSESGLAFDADDASVDPDLDESDEQLLDMKIVVLESN